MSASAAMMVGAGIQAVGTASAINSQSKAINRENYRIETERQMARLSAIQEENARSTLALEEQANNAAYQSIAGYSDDSMSFLNMNKQIESSRVKDISDIRLMGKSVDTKFSQQTFENQQKANALRFGGYTSIVAGLMNGYSTSRYYDMKNKG